MWQIMGCELHRNAYGGRAPTGTAGGVIALPKALSRYKGEERERMGRKGLDTVRVRKVVRKVGKGRTR